MLMALKTPMGILCHCILSPLLLVSTISQRNVCVCFQASQSGSVTLCCFSSWLLPPSIPFSLCLLSYISTPLPFFNSLSPFFLFISLVCSLCLLPMLNFPQFPCPVISLLHFILFSCGRPPLPFFLLVLLTGRG